MAWSHSFTVILSCLFFSCVLSAQTEVENESHFSYRTNSTDGPHRWGSLARAWNQCGTGKFQSPVDLSSTKRVITLQSADIHLKKNYKPAPAIIKNRGHDIMVQWEGDAGGMVINGTRYRLVQAHWHTPSEHILRGKRAHMEVHMVHTNEANQIAVVAVLYKLGRPDQFLRHLLDEIHYMTVREEVPAGIIDPNEVGFHSKTIYRYVGSLTVPPCTEGVIWSVLRKKKTVSIEQIHALRNAVHDGYEDNARPIQQ